MMVPQMQGDIIRAALKADPNIRQILDPFVGSGTALTESMMLGKRFVGIDINPLAILLCRAKTIPFFDAALKQHFDELMATVNDDRSCKLATTFCGWNKWFRRDVAIRLSRLRRGIESIDAKWARRFFWIALAETVRLSSNSRTSTFKLHIRPDDEISRTLSPVAMFNRIAARNLAHLKTAKAVFEERGLLSRGRYSETVNLSLHDSAVKRDALVDGESDFLITSPPYGDNATTIPYGQHSFLPLQWVQLEDIDPVANVDFLKSTHEIDTRSLGGSKVIANKQVTKLRQRSRTFAECLRRLKSEPADRAARVTAFCRDLNECIDPILDRLKPNSYMVWIVGNRKVAGRSFPLDRILSDFLVSRGAERIAQIKRVIPTKRMAVRNNIAETMGRESILVLRNGGSRES